MNLYQITPPCTEDSPRHYFVSAESLADLAKVLEANGITALSMETLGFSHDHLPANIFSTNFPAVAG